MAEIINTKTDTNGRVIVYIFKKAYDVTDDIENGKAYLNIYGKDYKVLVTDGKDDNRVSQNRRSKKIRK